MGKHAYLIMAHGDWYTLKTLLKMIDNARNDIFLHIDKKSNPEFQELKSAVQKSNLYFTERVSVMWGGTAK